MTTSDYERRFSRNIGVISEDEQARLRASKVAVAGLGGLGGLTFMNLVRMGINRFAVADIDNFDIANSNRQIGATQSSYGQTKVGVMAAMARDVNPDLEIQEFRQGVQPDAVDTLIESADVVVDSLDFFCLTARRTLYAACERHHKTVILSAPLGFSATLHAFVPGQMSTAAYFGWRDGQDKFEQMLRFTLGMAPAGLHFKYLRFDKEKLASRGTGPSIASACHLGSAMLANEVLVALLKRRPLFAAPWFSQFDPYTGVYVRRKLRFGNAGPLQRLKLAVARREFADVREQLLKVIK